MNIEKREVKVNEERVQFFGANRKSSLQLTV